MPAPAVAQLMSAQSAAAAFNPLSIAWLYAYWAEDPGWTNPGDGNPVSTWRDAGSAGKDMTGVTTSRPRYESTVSLLNNKPGVVFDGVDDVLATAALGVGRSQAFSVVAIASADSLAAQRTLCDTNASIGRVFINGNAGNWEIFAGTTGSGSVQTGAGAVAGGHLFYATFAGANSDLEVDGAAIITNQNAGSDAIASGSIFKLGSDRNGNPWWLGAISFWGFISGALSAPDLAAIEAWATSHYGITIA